MPYHRSISSMSIVGEAMVASVTDLLANFMVLIRDAAWSCNFLAAPILEHNTVIISTV